MATTNRSKVSEINEILTRSGTEIVGLDEMNAMLEPEETGATFGENALIKARHYFSLTGLVTVADDSGLEVQELAGAPGVRSARYAGPGATDRERFGKLLAQLAGSPEVRRDARFVCAASIVWAGGQRLFVEEVSGNIISEPRGSSGFGYDPVFWYPPLGKTFGELSRAEKSNISHRGKAFRRLALWLQQARTGLC